MRNLRQQDTLVGRRNPAAWKAFKKWRRGRGHYLDNDGQRNAWWIFLCGWRAARQRVKS